MTEGPHTHAPRALRIHQSPLERARLWVEIFAFIAAGCWALYTFVYQTKLAPGFLPAHEIVSVDVRRVGMTPSNYLESLSVTIYNDGSVDVDTAALAVTVFGLRPSGETSLQSQTAATDPSYRSLPQTAWQPVYSVGLLNDGAITGKRRRHFWLHPGDKVTDEKLAVVPRSYRVLQVHLETLYARYPIEPRLPVGLMRKGGAIVLRSQNRSIALDAYFGV